MATQNYMLSISASKISQQANIMVPWKDFMITCSWYPMDEDWIDTRMPNLLAIIVTIEVYLCHHIPCRGEAFQRFQERSIVMEKYSYQNQPIYRLSLDNTWCNEILWNPIRKGPYQHFHLLYAHSNLIAPQNGKSSISTVFVLIFYTFKWPMTQFSI